MNNWMLLGLVALGLKISEFQGDVNINSYYQPVIGSYLSPKNTVLVFDWHEVLQRQHFHRITLKLLYRQKNALKHFFRPSFWHDVKKLLGKKMVTEKMLEELESIYPGLGNIKEEFIKAVNEEPLIEENVELLKTLKSEGYAVYMLSNIAPETFYELKKVHPGVLDLFDGIYMPNEENGYIQKPNPEFYAKFKQFLTQHGQGNKAVLFVDDREKNVKAGFDAGLYGIVFSSTGELKKIMSELKLLEIET